MDLMHGDAHFTSVKIECNMDGYVGQELHCKKNGRNEVVAKMIFWDADGQFAVETMGEVPLVLLEQFIAETKRMIPI